MSADGATATNGASSSLGSLPSPNHPQQQPPTPSSPQTSSSASRKGGRKTGSVNWTPEKVDKLLAEVAAVLPRGHEGWELVTQRYNAAAGEQSDFERLKTKFFRLVGTRDAIGKHTRPEQVARAQDINRQIDDKSYTAQQLVKGEDGEQDNGSTEQASSSSNSNSDRQHSTAVAPQLSPIQSASSSPTSSPPPLPRLPASSSTSISIPTASLPTLSFSTPATKRAKLSSDASGANSPLSVSLAEALRAMAEVTAAAEERREARWREERREERRQERQELHELRKEEMKLQAELHREQLKLLLDHLQK